MAPSLSPLFSRNLLLRSLAPMDRDRLAVHAQHVDLSVGEGLFEPGEPVRAMTFPLDGTVTALLVVLRDGRSIETAVVGREGAIGGVVSQGTLPAFSRAVVRMGGPALRIGAEPIQAAKHGSPALRNALARYADCFLAQVLQSVGCNAVHPIEQRCAKWLLTLQDRLGTETLPVTQEVLAEMLGVRRTYLSGILRGLHRQDLIALGRGRVTIRDRAALKASACECHGRVRAHFTEVLGPVYGIDAADASASPGRRSARPTARVA